MISRQRPAPLSSPAREDELDPCVEVAPVEQTGQAVVHGQFGHLGEQVGVGEGQRDLRPEEHECVQLDVHEDRALC